MRLRHNVRIAEQKEAWQNYGARLGSESHNLPHKKKQATQKGEVLSGEIT
jgi:hypothetical protein